MYLLIVIIINTIIMSSTDLNMSLTRRHTFDSLNFRSINSNLPTHTSTTHTSHNSSHRISHHLHTHTPIDAAHSTPYESALCLPLPISPDDPNEDNTFFQRIIPSSQPPITTHPIQKDHNQPTVCEQDVLLHNITTIPTPHIGNLPIDSSSSDGSSIDPLLNDSNSNVDHQREEDRNVSTIACPTQINQELALPASSPTDAPASESATVLIDYSTLLPSNEKTIAEIVASSHFPKWINDVLQTRPFAIECMKQTPSTAEIKQYLVLACRSAIDIVNTTKEDELQLAYSKEKLIAANSETHIIIGYGILSAAIKDYCRKEYTLKPSLGNLTHMRWIDAMCRAILRRIHQSIPNQSIIRYILSVYLKSISPGLLPNAASHHIVDESRVPVHIASSSTELTPTLTSVHVIPTSGENCQCFWRCVDTAIPHESATGIRSFEKHKQLIEQAVKETDDVKLLADLGFWSESMKDVVSNNAIFTESYIQTLVANEKHAYLSSGDYVNMRWAGAREMILFSYGHQGAVNFRIIMPGEKPLLNRSPCHPVTNDTKEITLLHSSYNGDSELPNHYDLIEYVMSDGSRMKYWNNTETETETQLRHRLQLLQDATEQAKKLRLDEARTRADGDFAAALALEQNPSTASTSCSSDDESDNESEYATEQRPTLLRSKLTPISPQAGRPNATATAQRSVSFQESPSTKWRLAPVTRITTPRREKRGRHQRRTRIQNSNNPAPLNQLRLHFSPSRTVHDSEARSLSLNMSMDSSSTSTVALTQSNSTKNWKQVRHPTMSEIHPKNAELFCQSAGALFEAYGIHAMVDDAQHDQNRAQRHQIAEAIMNYPMKTLIKARNIRPHDRVQLMVQSEAHQLLQRAKSMYRSISISHPTPVLTDQGEITSQSSDLVPIQDEATSVSNPIVIATTMTQPIAGQIVISDSESDDEVSPSDHPEGQMECKSDLEQVNTDLELTQPNEFEVEIQLARSIRNAVRIYNEGGPHCISRAVNALGRAPLATLNRETKEKLTALHPVARERIPPLSMHLQSGTNPVIEIQHLGKIIKQRIHNGSAAGVSGWSGSHMMMLWDHEKSSNQVRKGMELFIRDICNGYFTGVVKDRLLASRLIPLSKQDKKNGIRPIAIGEVFTKCASHCMMALIEDKMKIFFPCIQYGVKHPGGSETAAQLVRALLNQSSQVHKDSIVLKTDFKNAFNSISRSLVWKSLLKHKDAAPILKAFHYQYSSSSSLLVYDNRSNELSMELESTEGVRQGCPFAAFAFALTVQSLYESAVKQVKDCHAVSIQDDLSIIGPSEQVMRVFQYIIDHAASEFSLQLTIEKCQVYIPSQIKQQDIEAGSTRYDSIVTMCKEKNISFSDHMESLGVMYGDHAHTELYCDQVVSSSEQLFRALIHKEMPKQIALSLLRYCGITKLGYLTRTTHPDRLEAATQRFDQLTIDTVKQMLSIDDHSLTQLQHEHDQADSYVTRDQLLTRISLPISMGGLGIRPVTRIRHAAYFSSLLQMLNEFISIHPHLNTNQIHSTQVYQELNQCRNTLLQQCSIPTTVTFTTAKTTTVTGEPTKNRRTSLELPSLSSPSTTLVKSIDETWSSAANHINSNHSLNHNHNNNVQVKSSPIIALANKLQANITHLIENSIHNELFESCNASQRTIITACSEHVGAGSFLTVIPTQFETTYRMKNEQFCLAIRHRLGMLPYDELAGEECLQCLHRNIHRPSFRADPDHLHSCTLQAGSSVSRRHHRLVHQVASLAKSVGFHTTIEPSFPAVITTATHPTTNQLTHTKEQSKDRGDLLLIRGNQVILIDVSVTRPTSTTNLTLTQKKDVTIQPGIAASIVEQRKHARYDEECKKHGWRLIPFALESYGGYGKEATKLLLDMAELADSPLAFIQHARNALSVVLQCGNADISLLGTTQFLSHKHTLSLSSHTSSFSRVASAIAS